MHHKQIALHTLESLLGVQGICSSGTNARNEEIPLHLGAKGTRRMPAAE